MAHAAAGDAAAGIGRDDGRRYTRIAIWLHWTIAALVIVNLAIGLFHEALDGVPLIPLHKSIGIAVLALSLVRLGWRLSHRPPPTPHDIPAWQRHVAHATHWAFYALILVMPLSGWWFVSAAEKRRPLDFFGLFRVPYLPVTGGGDAMYGVHHWLGYGMAALVVLHVAAALKHHLVDRDATLLHIAPILRR